MIITSRPSRLITGLLCACVFLISVPCHGEPTTQSATDAPQELKLYCVGYAHLDTQWRWSYPQVISEFLHNTLRDNFQLFQKYPHYIFNFTGANRYMMFKEYYPQDYELLKKYIAAGRWFPAGSSVEEGDVNMPSGEAIIRQVLYGNEFFRREFGKQSAEFMLPDCFGFQATLPSLLAHCGVKGFSTQKLTWGSAVGIPFNVGVWEGPDGASVVAAFNPGDYTGSITQDLSHDPKWQERIERNGQASGFYGDYHYYGTGDRGGSPKEQSIEWLEKSIAGRGPVHVISSTAEQMFLDLTPQQIAKLPRYKGDLLLTNHSAGCLTSQAFIKRMNRKNEELADAAERISLVADWLGSAAYPMQKLNSAWMLALGAHFHDTMAGTALPKADEYSWNNMVLAANQFAAAVEDGAGAVIRAMNTQAQGVPIVVFNPLSIEREDVVEATVAVPNSAGDTIEVFDPNGNVVPSQAQDRTDSTLKILFLAKVPSVGLVTYDVRRASSPQRSSSPPAGELSVSENRLENGRFRVTLNRDGDIESIFDKANQREVLSAPARLAFLHEKPAMYPAWNMDWEDRRKPPRAYVDGPCKMRVAEAGPARVAIEVERESQGSRFTQQIRLAGGGAGDRVEVRTLVDWQTSESSLEAVFPLSAGNPMATYESQSAAVERGNNDAKKFEVPQQQWFDVTATDGGYGTAILNDCKYGSDKPDDHTVRLTLLYTPGVTGSYQDQATQDFGRHEMVYAIAPHSGSWQQGAVPGQAQRVNQPLIAFQCSSSHDGPLGRSFSLLDVSDNLHVTLMALKRAEDSDETVVRLHETAGERAAGVQLRMAGAIESAREVDGQERTIGSATVRDGRLIADLSPFQIRAFAVKMASAPVRLQKPISQPVPLAYDLDAVSRHENLTDGAFDGEGRTFTAESWPSKIDTEGIQFAMGPADDGKANCVVCRGQTIQLPSDQAYDRVYVLAAAADGDQTVKFDFGGNQHRLTVQDWGGFIGQWDDRQWQGVVPGLTYNWDNRYAGLVPGFTKRDTVAWFCSHRHHPQNGNEYYSFTYLFKYGFDLPVGPAHTLTLPANEHVRVFAITVAKNTHDDAHAARPLYDTLQDHVPDRGPTITPNGGAFSDGTELRIDHPLYWTAGHLHYTLDGSEATAASPVYMQQPIALASATKLRTREIDADGRPAGPETSAYFDVRDITPPAVTSVVGIAPLPTLEVTFSESVARQDAESASNYRLEPNDDGVRAAILSGDGRHVTLTLTAPLSDLAYHLTVSNVRDLSPTANRIVPAPVPVAIARPVFQIDSFVCDGRSLEKDLPALPMRANDPWTMSMLVRIPHQLEDRTVIAGFGAATDDTSPDGAGRYLSKFPSGIHFWARHADVDTRTRLDVNRWQMLVATYDGKTLSLYKDGKLIGGRDVDLVDDTEPIVRIAPLDPWEKRRRFVGEIREFTIWRGLLPPEALASLGAHSLDLGHGGGAGGDGGDAAVSGASH
jgi:alpha-mannosidase